MKKSILIPILMLAFLLMASIASADVVTILPNANGDEVDWRDEIPAVAHYLNVDEGSSHDGHTTRASESWIGSRDEYYHFQDTSITGCAISNVRVSVALMVDNPNPEDYGFLIEIKTGGTIYEGTCIYQPSEEYPYYDIFNEDWAVNPADSQPWEDADIDALQAGIGFNTCGLDGRIHYLTAIWINVTYSCVVAPILTTNASTNVNSTGATLNGFLSLNGSGQTWVGFTYDKDGSAPWTNNVTVSDSQATATTFSQIVTGLDPNTKYYFQAWANNSVGFTTGDVLNFTTGANNDPVISARLPADNVLWQNSPINISFDVDDADDQALTVDLYVDTGEHVSWSAQSNDSSFYYNTSYAYNQSVSWFVTMNDGVTNITSSSYDFTMWYYPSLSSPSPSNTESQVSYATTLSITLDMTLDCTNNTVWFYWSDDTLIEKVENAGDGLVSTSAQELAFQNSYSWYAVAGNDNGQNTTSATYSFETESQENIISINASQFTIILMMCLFGFWFYVGYSSEKKSGGAFMLFAGATLFYIEVILLPYVSVIYVIPFISPLAIFIILLGIKKFLYTEPEDTKTRD